MELLGVHREEGLPCYFTEGEFFRIQKSHLLDLIQPMIAPLKEGELFLEKSGQHARCIPDIVSMLPEARFIHILRDPRDVVASLLAANRSWGAWWAPGHAKAAAQIWVRHVRPAREAGRSLPSWQMLEIKYEDLLTDTEAQLKSCADFLGRSWSPDSLSEAIRENAPSAALRKGGGSPIPLRGEAAKFLESRVTEPEGFVRKARVGSWRTDLTLKEKLKTWIIVKDLMAEVGYEWPDFAPLEAVINKMPKRFASKFLPVAQTPNSRA